MSVSLCVQHCPKTETHDNLKKEKKQTITVERMDELVFTSDGVGVIIIVGVIREVKTQ